MLVPFFYCPGRYQNVLGMSITVSEAGRKGGLKVLRKRGKEYFSQIGRKGQAAMRRKHPGMASYWGKQGGRPRKPTLAEIAGENGQIYEEEVVAGPPSVMPVSPTQKYSNHHT